MSWRGSVKMNVMASWLHHLVALVIGVFLMPFVLNTLGDEAYGTWIFITSIAGYSGLLYLGFGETISRYVARYHARENWQRLNQVVTAIFVVYCSTGVLALLIAGGLCWAAPYLYDWGGISVFEVRCVILLLGLNTAVGLAGSVYGGVLMGIQRYDLERYIELISAIVRLLLTVFFLQEKWGLITIAGIFLAVTLLENVGCAILAYRLQKTLSIRPRHFSISALKECLSFSFFAFLEDVAGKLISATDTIVIGFYFSAAAIVPYYIALRLMQFVSQPIQMIGRVVMPRAGHLHAKEDARRMRALVLKSMGAVFLLATGFFIGAAYFGNDLIGIWIGHSYPQSYAILLVLLGMRIVAIPAGVVRCVLFGMGIVQIPAYIYFLEALANLGLSLLLIGPLGLLGVALGTLIPVIVIELGLLLPYGFKTLGLTWSEVLREAIGPQLLPLAALWAYSTTVAAHWGPLVGWPAILAVSAGGGVVLAAVWLASSKRIWTDCGLLTPSAS